MLLLLVGIVSPVYLALLASALSTGQVEVRGLVWALVVPSLVVGGAKCSRFANALVHLGFCQIDQQ